MIIGGEFKYEVDIERLKRSIYKKFHHLEDYEKLMEFLENETPILKFKYN
jgi:hypothetical protein